MKHHCKSESWSCMHLKCLFRTTEPNNSNCFKEYISANGVLYRSDDLYIKSENSELKFAMNRISITYSDILQVIQGSIGSTQRNKVCNWKRNKYWIPLLCWFFLTFAFCLFKVDHRRRVEELWNVPQRWLQKGQLSIEMLCKNVSHKNCWFEEEKMAGHDELRVERGCKPACRLEVEKWGQLHLFPKVPPIDKAWNFDTHCFVFWYCFDWQANPEFPLCFQLHFHCSPTGEKQFNERRTALQYMIQVNWQKLTKHHSTIQYTLISPWCYIHLR